MSYKKETKKTYDLYAKVFEDESKNYLQNYLLNDINLFIQNLHGKKILDVGSGPGRDSIFFKEKGLEPICIDISPSMIALCKEKGLEAYLMDLENIDFAESSFDGVWAYTSLLHVPKKNISSVLDQINFLLKKDGVFYLGIKEGNFEGYLESAKYPDTKRFFAFYEDEEMRELLSRNFELLNTSKVELNDTFLNYLCKKNN